MNEEENKISLMMITSFNDSKDIYIYDKGISIEDAEVSGSFYFIRNKRGKITKLYQQSDINIQNGEVILFRTRKSKNKTLVIMNPINKNMEKTNNNILNLNNKLWYVIKSEPNNHKFNNTEDYILNKNDIIRFGNSTYEVIEKNIENINQKEKIEEKKKINPYDISNLNKNSQSIFKIIEIKNADYSNQNENELCRICFDGASSIDNPKLCLCNCKDYIHYECLKNWIKTKIHKRTNYKKTVLSYSIKKFNCDVCLKHYPLKFKICGLDNEYSLIDLETPLGENYIVLESLWTSDGNNQKVFHIVKLIDEIITFGRKDYCDIFDCSSFVSNTHAIIKYNNKNGDVILENKNANYDTLILVKDAVIIKRTKIYFQVGRTIITAYLKKNTKNK